MKSISGREVPLSWNIVAARDYHGFYQFDKLNWLVRVDEIVQLDKNEDSFSLYQLLTLNASKKLYILVTFSLSKRVNTQDQYLNTKIQRK